MIDILSECRGSKKIAVTGHTNPDGDCIGSTLALRQFLINAFQGQEVSVNVLLEKPDASFDVIKGVESIMTQADDTVYDVVFVLDSIAERCGHAQDCIKSAGKVINIDHHVSNPGQGDVSFVVPEAAACGEVLYDLFCYREEYKKFIDADVALALYIAIIHDTGVMQYSNTSPKTLRVLADLIGYGFDFTRIIDETFYEKTYVQSQILGRALLESFSLLDGQVMVSHVSQKTMQFYGAVKSDLSGIVNQLRIVKGVKIAVFIYETGPMEQKVSLRSGSDNEDVSKIAMHFGGGGHVRAAGCNMNGNFYDVLNALMEQIEPVINAG